MADQAELAFVRNFTNTLASQPVTFDNDFQQPPDNTLKRVPVLQVRSMFLLRLKGRLPRHHPSANTVQVTFKSSKPPFSISIPVSLADSISTIKTQLASQHHAPPADTQRLLLKGKALADTKLLKEYSVKEGDTVNLMVKPGFEWDPTKETPAPSESSATLSPNASAGKRRGHGRIPSVVLSPTPSSATEEVQDIPLVDESGITVAYEHSRSSSPIPQTTYRTTISQPEFWEKLHTFLSSEFSSHDDAATAFDNFLNASKGLLTPHEIAKIRDHVGVVGMAGT
ncbi:hypothetical protein EVG20_g2064 [Dentipellis fragilis]|uniref:Ubiquitin-like domain-containing protein n=1 Tax=Dentipellis fragilis TaxID=205917 RepID=A0A4Y9ZAA1_9AGAM|nr:hypothetical protein EVG20_g2064 [Dentipellis fragilis]